MDGCGFSGRCPPTAAGMTEKTLFPPHFRHFRFTPDFCHSRAGGSVLLFHLHTGLGAAVRAKQENVFSAGAGSHDHAF